MEGYPKGFDDWPEQMTVDDIAAALDMSTKAASKWMNQPGFPLINPGYRRNRKVNKFQLIKYMRGDER